MEELNQESQLEFKSPEEKGLFESMMKYQTGSQAVANIILCLEGIKPVSEFDIPGYEIEEIAHVKYLLNEFGFFIEEGEVEVEPGLMSHRFDISLSEDLLKKHLELQRDDTPLNEYYIKLSSFYGYPLTAAQGFVSEERMEYEDLPKEVLESELGKISANLSFFILSKHHWQEELGVLESWFSVIKEKYPLIYKMFFIEMYLEQLDGEEISEHLKSWDENKKQFALKTLTSIDIDDLSVERLKQEILAID